MAQSSLSFDIHDGNKRPIVIISGNTYPIYQKLKTMGFTWYGVRKIWWMYRDRFDLNKDANVMALSSLGVSTPVGSANATTPIASPDPTGASPVQQEEKTDIQTPIDTKSNPANPANPANPVVKTDKTTGLQKYGPTFPVNSKIYETDIEVVHEGQPLTFHFVWGRKQNEKYNRTIPKYDVSAFWNNILLRKKSINPPEGDRWNKSGPNYDEDKLVADYMAKVPGLASDPKAYLYRAIKWELEFDKNEPEYTELLKKINTDNFGTDYSAYFPPRQIHLDEPGLEGDFALKIEPRIFLDERDLGMLITTSVKHDLAPTPASLGRIKLPVTIHNLADANATIDQQISQHTNELKVGYVAYLKSFAFTQQQQEQASAEVKEIVDLIVSGNVDVGFIKSEMVKRKFVRPSKRGKRNQDGGDESFQLIIDDKAISNARRKWNTNSPEYFWTSIAYNILRIKRHEDVEYAEKITSTYSDVWDIIKAFYDKNFSFEAVVTYIRNAARAVYTDVTGKSYQNWSEAYQDFYSGKGRRAPGSGQNYYTGTGYSGGGGGGGGGGEARQPRRPEGNHLEIFSTFVGGLNLGITKEEAAIQPKSTYRKLALLLHPDVTKLEDKDYAEDMFAALASLYNNLPQEIKNAKNKNWYKTIKI